MVEWHNGMHLALKTRPAPNIIKCETVSDGSFYVLESPANRSTNQMCVVFLHGLGESRSGINYLFRDLSHSLCDEGFSTFRFDLAGCGNSTLPLSLSIWEKQLKALNSLTNKFKKVYFISRGLSSLILPHEMHSIALVPFLHDHFMSYIEQIPTILDHMHWIPNADREIPLSEQYFWFNLGVEAGCLGGFSIPKKFLNEIKKWNKNISERWTIFFAGDQWQSSLLPKHTHHLKECHPLFLFQKDKYRIIALLKGILNA